MKIAFDTETTGLDRGSRPVEFAAVLFDETGIIDRFQSLVNPCMPIPADVTAIHGITDDMVKDAPMFDDVLARFLAWRQSDVLVAHNAPYDTGIVSWSAGMFGVEIPASIQVVDTVEIAKSLKLTANNRLSTLVDFHGIVVGGEDHRALHDAEACAKYFLMQSDQSYAHRAWHDAGHDFAYTMDFPVNLSMLPALVATGHVLDFTYKDDKGVTTERSITPYGWCEQRGVLYFHGLCHSRGERRTFRADRVENVEARKPATIGEAA